MAASIGRLAALVFVAMGHAASYDNRTVSTVAGPYQVAGQPPTIQSVNHDRRTLSLLKLKDRPAILRSSPNCLLI